MQESTVTDTGQTTLPKPVRTALGLRPGDRVRYVILDGEARLFRARSLSELKGLLVDPSRPPVSLDEMEEAIAGGASRSWCAGPG